MEWDIENTLRMLSNHDNIIVMINFFVDEHDYLDEMFVYFDKISTKVKWFIRHTRKCSVSSDKYPLIVNILRRLA